jgi:hypothetical protein
MRQVWLIFLGVILMGCSSSQPSGSSPAASSLGERLPSGKIQALVVVGDVRLADAVGHSQVLRKGQIFQADSTIITGAGAGVTLAFSNGATVRVKENSRLSINKFTQAPYDEAREGTFLRLARNPSHSEVVLAVRRGTVEGEVRSLNQAAGSSFRITTPSQGSQDINGAFQFSEPQA